MFTMEMRLKVWNMYFQIYLLFRNLGVEENLIKIIHNTEYISSTYMNLYRFRKDVLTCVENEFAQWR